MFNTKKQTRHKVIFKKFFEYLLKGYKMNDSTVKVSMNKFYATSEI